MEEPRRLGGRYELGQVLGRGGMAEVYLAHDTRLGRTVAVKTLRADLARDPSFQARFRREAQSAASLNHPAIVAVYDTGEDYVDGVSIPYIVMEYVDGSTLRELLHSGRKLLPERSMEMTIGILQALEYSHRSGIVHRDIKPANVMLTRTGQVKVMDFGIARAMGDAGMTMTQTAAVIGTAQYLSPEQAKGETVDARSDLYSTGCLLYELLTVRPPFVGDSPVAVAYQHVREEAQPPSVYDPEITPEMDAIVLRALVKDPDYRYQSADEMRADIEACLDGQPVAAAAAMGAAAYGAYGSPDDQATTAMRPQDGGAPPTSMLPPMNPDDGSYGYDDRPDRRRQKKSSTSTVLLVVAGVLVLIGAIWIGKSLFGGNGAADDRVPVPSLVGETFADAKAKAANVDLKVDVSAKKECEAQPKDHVCSQDPKNGDIAKNGTISLVISTGAPKVTVPIVVNFALDDAKQTLSDHNLKAKIEYKETTGEADLVLDQNPVGGKQVEKGSEITLTVSKERKQVQVPDLTGQTCEDAKKTLSDSKLQGTCTDVENGDAQEGTVFGQSLDPGTDADPGSTVELKVAKAPADQQQPPVTVPDGLAGKPLSQVQQQLSQLGLQPQLKPGSSNDPNAPVIGTQPGSGSQLKPGDPITVITLPGGNGHGGPGDNSGFPGT